MTLIVAAGAVHAQQQLTFANAGSSQAATISDNGSRVAFQSTAALGSGTNNPDAGNEIFVVDSDGSDRSQLTVSPGTSEQPAISGNGARVAFISNADFTGNNADGNAEIFVADTTGGRIRQATDSNGPTAIQAPRLSTDGTRVTFSAAADLLGDGSNDDGSREIFAVDADGANLVQLTDGPTNTNSQFPDISPGGGRVVFSSNADLAGNNDDGNSEIFIVASDGDSDPDQVTDTDSGQSSRPSIADGGLIAFESSADLDSNNSDGNIEIFVIEADGSGAIQLTDATNGNSGFAQISTNGENVVFQSTADLDGNNDDASNEIFIADTGGSNVDQLTRQAQDSQQPSISGNGERVAFQSSADITGNNSEGNSEIFVLDPATDGVSNGGADPDSFLCKKLAEGCSFCDDDNNDSDNKTAMINRGVDPTLALLALLAWVRVVRRRR